MRNSNQLGVTIKRQREALGLTQRSLAQKLDVEASHVAFIESGRRKPSLKLVARLADVLDLDPQGLLIQAHPEAKELIAESKPEQRRKTAPSWRRFIENKQLLVRYNVTDRELRALEGLSFLGTVTNQRPDSGMTPACGNLNACAFQALSPFLVYSPGTTVKPRMPTRERQVHGPCPSTAACSCSGLSGADWGDDEVLNSD